MKALSEEACVNFPVSRAGLFCKESVGCDFVKGDCTTGLVAVGLLTCAVKQAVINKSGKMRKQHRTARSLFSRRCALITE
jgi:hypothetical protein